MRMIRGKVLAAWTLGVGLAATGAGVLAARPSGLAQQPRDAAAKDDPAAAKPGAEPARPSPRGGAPGMSDVLIRYSGSRERAWGYSPVTKTWRTYKTPAGVKTADFLMAEPAPGPVKKVVFPLVLHGEEIREVAVFDAQIGAWVPQALATPARNQCYPIGGPRYAIYHSGRHVYAYSVGTGRWAARDLGEEATKHAIDRPGMMGNDFNAIDLGNNSALVLVYGRYLCGFLAPTGSWDVLVLEEQNSLRFRQGATRDQPFFIARGEQLMTFDRETGKFREVETDEKEGGKP